MKKIIYLIILVISIVLFILSFTIWANTEYLGGIAIGVGVYLFLGTIIKICKNNEKLKNVFINVLDLLFWLP